MEEALELARREWRWRRRIRASGRWWSTATGEIVGRGFHTYDGQKHAEVLAIEEAGDRARGATLYLNLEPCSHTGRTGPCADALIKAGVKRVVAAMSDPNPAGGVDAVLRNCAAAGIEVHEGLLRTRKRRS